MTGASCNIIPDELLFRNLFGTLNVDFFLLILEDFFPNLVNFFNSIQRFI